MSKLNKLNKVNKANKADNITVWEHDDIQFPRLIAELDAAGAFSSQVVSDICGSMDLTPNDINRIISRAEKKWDKIQKEINFAIDNVSVR